jgi:cysteine desulfurase
MRNAVYMDYNASVPIRAEAAAAVAAALSMGGNPSSVHGHGRAARRLLEDAREQVAASIGAPAPAIVFTSGATEANALALRGTGRSRILVSAIEHDSVRQAAAEAEIVPVTPAGVVDLGALGAMLANDSRPALVSLMLANNETGVIQPVAEAARLAHAHGALIHSDAVQAVGRIPVDVRALDVDLLSLSAHKLGGPAGVGALYRREGVALAPQLRGGGQERSQRAGTENVAGIAGFGVAAALASNDLEKAGRLADLRDGLEKRIADAAPHAVLFGATVERLPNTVYVALPGISAETQIMALDLAGVSVSAGAACSSGKVKISAVLSAMAAPADLARSAIRVSLGWASKESDIDRFMAAWTGLSARSLAA